ncbi:MAG TPA: class I SAM-dependent methyltransferase [Polyangiaceae bacterium]
MKALWLVPMMAAIGCHAPASTGTANANPNASSIANANANATPIANANANTDAGWNGEDANGAFLGRVPASPMSFQGAWWLDRAGRDDVQKPEHVLDVIGVKPAMTVADIGCGSGYFSVKIAKRVTPGGKVLAVDLQPEMLALLDKKVKATKVDNVVPVLATEGDVGLPKGAVDIAFFVDVYHELGHPLRTMTQVKDALTPTGKVVLVEYRAEDPKVDIKPEHKTTLAQLKKELDFEGYDFVSSDESLPEQRIVTFVPRSRDH